MTAKNWMLLILAAAAVCAVPARSRATAAPSAAKAQTETIVASTRAFLNSLSTAQRVKVQLPFTARKTATSTPCIVIRPNDYGTKLTDIQ